MKHNTKWIIYPSLLVIFIIAPFIHAQTLTTQLSATQTTITYKFPWMANLSWQWWQGWHDPIPPGTPTTHTGLDFGTGGSDRRILSAAVGTIKYICVGTFSVNIQIQHEADVVIEYGHLDKNDYDTTLKVGDGIQQGQVLGSVKPGTWSDGCGSTSQRTTTAHLHIGLPPSRSITFDGWTIQYPNNYFTNGTQTKSIRPCCPYETFLSSNQLFSPATPHNDYNGDGKPDLYAIAKTGGGSGKTDLYILNGADNYQSYLFTSATILGYTDGPAWAFNVEDYNSDGKPDLYAIAKTGGGSGKTDLYILNAYGSRTCHAKFAGLVCGTMRA